MVLASVSARLVKCAAVLGNAAAVLVANIRCAGSLAGDSFSTDVDCTPFAVTIMECFVRGHEGSPQPVRNVEYEVLGKNKLKVSS